ncbi:MAG: NACHT domain-containing protein [Dehalococcoidales bacterium]|nr:NACHT domain-containing protein [Dehalococcoidales bacterium]
MDIYGLLLSIKEESELRETLAILFRKITEYHDVQIVHGASEHGKDLVFYELEKLSNERKYVAVNVKVGKIGGGTTRKSEELAINIQHQVELAFKVPHLDSDGKEWQITKVFVITNDTISPNARKQIQSFFKDNPNLIFLPIERLVDIFKKYWPDYTRIQNPYIANYLISIKNEFDNLKDLVIFGYAKNIRFLTDIFIDYRLKEDREFIKKGEISKEKIYNLTDLINDKGNYFIKGGPGTGKTTLCKKLVINIVENSIKDGRCEIFPLFITFKELDLSDSLLLCSRAVLSNYNIDMDNIDLVSRCSLGSIIICIDGFDELNNDDSRLRCLVKLQEFTKLYANVRIICTSRNIDYLLTASVNEYLHNFKVLEVDPWGLKQIMGFVDKWFSDKAHSQQLTQALHDRGILNKLPKTPLVITLLAIIYESRPGELPANLAELYSMYIDLCLGKWDASRRIENMFEFNIKKQLLSRLAWKMHGKKEEKLSQEELNNYTIQYFAEIGSAINVKSFLEEILCRSFLLQQNKDGNYQFRHLSFQDYFTANELSSPMIQGKKIINKHFLDNYWGDVIFFYFGINNRETGLLKELIKTTPKDLSEEFQKICLLGNCAQAAYLGHVSIREKAIEVGLEHLVEFIFAAIEASKKEEIIFHDCPAIVFYLIMKGIFVGNYTSISLERAYRGLLKKYSKKLVEASKSDKLYRKKLILYKYLLASALAYFKSYDELFKMTKEISAEDIDLTLTFVIKIDSDMIEEDALTENNKKIMKSLNRKFKRLKDVIKIEMIRPAYKLLTFKKDDVDKKKNQILEVKKVENVS